MRGTDRDAGLRALLDSRSIAVVGASTRPGSFGNGIVRSLLRTGYAGEIHPVNPRYESVEGLACYRDVGSIGHEVDHAVLVVPHAGVERAVLACVEAGTAAVSVMAGGYAEVPGGDADGQRRLMETTARRGVRLLGPNSLGVMNLGSGLVASASLAVDRLALTPGPVSIVTQSGAVGMSLIAHLEDRALGAHYFVSTGNEADIQIGECLQAIAPDPTTRVVIGYVEGVRDTEAYLAGLIALREAGKTVIILKPGGTEHTRAAIQSHTGAVAGEAAVHRAVLDRLGILEANSLSDAAWLAAAALDGDRAEAACSPVIISISGGLGILTLDALERAGFTPASLPANASDALRELTPRGSAANPVDVAGSIDRLVDVARLTAGVDGVTDLVVILEYLAGNNTVGADILIGLSRLPDEFGTTVWILGIPSPEVASRLDRPGLTFASDIDQIVDRLARRRRVETGCAVLPTWRPLGARPASPSPERTTRILNDLDGLSLLAEHDIPLVPWAEVRGIDEMDAVLGTLRAPFVVKNVADGVLHKSELGWVRTDLANQAQARQTIEELRSGAGTGVRTLVQEFRPAGVGELLLDVRRDELAGIVVTVGAGGTWVELLSDTATMVAPIDPTHLTERLDALRVGAVLRGVRGGPKGDITAFHQLIGAVVDFVAADPSLLEIELNPVMVDEDGHGVHVVDALVARAVPPTEETRR